MTIPGREGLEPRGGPTVRRIMLGAHLRRLREARNISRERAGYVIRSSESKISRMELGRVSFKERDVADLLELYGIREPAEREPLLTMARAANSPGWWHAFDDIMPNWFQTYVGLEAAACLIRTYEIQFVPGLLQTEDYIRAVHVAGSPDISTQELDRRVSLRLERQKSLTREEPPALWTVIDEAALRRPIGGRAVMRAQLGHLLEVTSLPNVTLQVMPFRFGGHAGEGGAFTILRFPEPDLPDTVYVEQFFSALYMDKPEQVDAYSRVMERMTSDSQPPDLSRATLERILDQL